MTLTKQLEEVIIQLQLAKERAELLNYPLMIPERIKLAQRLIVNVRNLVEEECNAKEKEEV